MPGTIEAPSDCFQAEARESEPIVGNEDDADNILVLSGFPFRLFDDDSGWFSWCIWGCGMEVSGDRRFAVAGGLAAFWSWFW